MSTTIPVKIRKAGIALTVLGLIGVIAGSVILRRVFVEMHNPAEADYDRIGSIMAFSVCLRRVSLDLLLVGLVLSALSYIAPGVRSLSMSSNPEPRPPESATQPVTRECGLARVSNNLGIFSLVFMVPAVLILAMLVPDWYFSRLLLGVLFAWLALAVSATATGFLARSRIKADSTLSGIGYSWAGIVLGCLVVGLSSFAIYIAIAKTPIGVQNACISNLKQIDGAKEGWGLENKKVATDIPTWNDLVGPDKGFKYQPTCPGRGTYTINDMAHPPLCTIADHTLY